MKFVLAGYGSRGDIEPVLAVGRELLRREHEVRIAVPPDLVGFAEAAEVPAVPYGLDSQAPWEAARNLSTGLFHNPWRVQELTKSWREFWELVTRCGIEMTTTLKALSERADLLVNGQGFVDAAANVAEYYDVPLAWLHFMPARPNGQFMPFLPAPMMRSVMTASEHLDWHIWKKIGYAQRRELGLPKVRGPVPGRITRRGSLEIQAYDEVLFPGLAAEWVKWNGQRPFVGALTLELPTDADEDVASWVAAGTPPIYFGFGSIQVGSPADTLNMISAACELLDERALVCAGWSDFSGLPHFDHVKVVGAVSHASIFPLCRAVVHHGGAGTTAAGLRAAAPTLILWTLPGQRNWGAAVKRLEVGAFRRLSSTTQESLVEDLRTILAPQYVTQVREISTRMTKPAAAVAHAADLLEDFARVRRIS